MFMIKDFFTDYFSFRSFVVFIPVILLRLVDIVVESSRQLRSDLLSFSSYPQSPIKEQKPNKIILNAYIYEASNFEF